MVFYFTGTGNSKWVADAMGNAFGERLVSITDEYKKGCKEHSYSLRKDEKIFFVYPVHSWGPAALVTRFISDLRLSGYEQQPVYSICVCGDDCAYTTQLLGKALKKRGISLTAGYSVTMPNNYILMKGFNVDNPEVEQQKLQEAPARVAAIVDTIRLHKSVNLYHKGSVPFLKSYLVYPLFINFAIGKTVFYVTDDCISCGLCERICPTGTISLKEGKPVWTDSCIQCVACIHRCPVRAIEYGKETVKKGRYRHPGIK